MPTYTIHNLNSEYFDGVTEEYNRNAETELRDDDDEEIEIDQGVYERKLLLSMIKKKRKHLPSSTFMANCHILINNERANNFILPLIREKELDKVASNHAKHTMDTNKCEHSYIENLIPEASWQR